MLGSVVSSIQRMDNRIDGLDRLLSRPLTPTRPEAIELPTPTDAQRVALTHPARFLVDHSGRGTGKTLASLLKFHAEIQRRPMAYWWVWPTIDAAREFAWDQYIRPYFDGVYHMTETTFTLKYPNGGYIRCVGADKVTAHNKRGGALGGFIMEECRNVKRHVYSEVLLPMVARTGGWGQFKSTPRPGSWFDALAREVDTLNAKAAAGGEMFEWGRVAFTAYDNPHHPQADIEMMRRNMTEREFLVEVMGELLTDGGLLFRNVAELCTLKEQAPVRGRAYVIGADWGRHNDETVFSVWDIGARKQVYLERLLGVGYHAQERRCADIALRYNRATVISEDNGIGDSTTEGIEAMGVRVVRWHSDPGRKRDLVLNGVKAFEGKAVALLDDDDQRAQLMAFETKQRASGLPAYGAPEDMHDDIVIADLLGILGMGEAAPVSEREAEAVLEVLS